MNGKVIPPATLRVLALADHIGHPGGRVHGGTTYFVSIYPALVRAGVDLTVVFMSGTHPVAENLEKSGVKPIFLSCPKIDFASAYFHVYRIAQERKAQVFHLASFKSHFLGRIVGRRLGSRCIVHLHDTVPLRRHVRLLQKSVRSDSDLALTVSDAVQPLAMRDYGFRPGQIETLHNAINIDKFSVNRPYARQSLISQYHLTSDSQLIGIIGRLALMKGHTYAIGAMPLVLKTCPRAKLLIFGEGETRDECAQLARRCRVDSEVIFAGQRNDMPDVLAGLDLVAMPSIHGEGLPYAAIEAIASGKPVVAYPTAGIPEVIHHEESGLLVEHARVDSLAQGIIRILSDEPLRNRLAAGARDYARQFTIERHVQALISKYKMLAPGGIQRGPLDRNPSGASLVR